jgi:hypothetical protein
LTPARLSYDVRQKSITNTFSMKTKYNKVATLAATLITFGSLAGGANGALIITDNGSTITLDWNETLVTTSVVSGGALHNLIYENMFSAAPAHSRSNPIISSFSSSITVNGIEASPTIWTGWNYRPGEADLLDTQQIAIIWNPTISAGVGDTLVFTGSMTLNSDSFYTVPDQAPSIVWFGSQGVKFTADTAVVPEPSSTFLIGLGVLGFASRRRRMN